MITVSVKILIGFGYYYVVRLKNKKTDSRFLYSRLMDYKTYFKKNILDKVKYFSLGKLVAEWGYIFELFEQ